MGKKHRIGLALLASAAAVWVLAGCGGGASAKTTIEICSELPISGADTSSGKPAENGVKLAISQANDKGTISGVTLVHSGYDDVGPSGKHDATKGATNIRSAIGDSLVAACVGPFNSAVAQAEMPIANNAPLGLISPSNTGVVLTKPEGGQLATLRPTGKVTYFRVSTTDDHQGPAGADFLIAKGFKKAFVMDDAETYGVGIANSFSTEFTAKGGTLVGTRQSIPDANNTKDYKPVITAAVAAGADVIYYGGTDSAGGIAVRTQMTQVAGADKLGYAGGDGLQTDTFKQATLAANAPGTYVTVASVNADKLSSATQFISDFKAVYTSPSDYGAYSANAYDATNIEIQAIKSALAGGAKAPKDKSDSDTAKTFRQAVIDQIAKISYDGVTGHTSFDSNGDTTNKIISIYQLGATSKDWDFVTQLTVQ